MAKVRRPLGYVELDEHGNEIGTFGKNDDVTPVVNTDKKVQDELASLFGEETASQFGKGGISDDIPRDVNGNIIDNKTVTITTVTPSVYINPKK